MEFTDEEIEDIRKIVKLAYIRIGIRCDLTGFGYLCYGTEKVIQNPWLINNLCNGLYVDIANKFAAAKPSSVERSIRHAIDSTQESKSFGELNNMFKTLLYAVDEKPTVGELIRLVAEYYLLGLYKHQKWHVII